MNTFINLQGHHLAGISGRVISISRTLVNFLLQMYILLMKLSEGRLRNEYVIGKKYGHAIGRPGIIPFEERLKSVVI